jgi:hypothetical protein
MNRFSRLPLFWRFQITGWSLFAVATLPLKLAAFPTVGAVVVLTLTRGAELGHVCKVGFRGSASSCRAIALATADARAQTAPASGLPTAA